MCLPRKIIWCSMFLLVASSSEPQENSMNSDKQNDSSTVQDDLLVNSMKYRNDDIEPIRCNSCENAIKNFGETQYKPNINSSKNNNKNDDPLQYESQGYIKDGEESNQISVESGMNSTESNDSMLQAIKNLSKIEDESNSTSYEVQHESLNAIYNNNGTPIIVPYEACENISCIQLCCPYNYYLAITGECVPAEKGSYYFPDFYEDDSEDEMDQSVYLTVHEPCRSQGLRLTKISRSFGYLLFGDGSLALFRVNSQDLKFKLYVPWTYYCLAIMDEDIYDVIICTELPQYETPQFEFLPIYVSVAILISLPCFLLTFVIYSILPELQNIHGYALRIYVASLFVIYAIKYGVTKFGMPDEKIICPTLAYIFNFFFLSSFFWLNVICFDIWWTFRKLRLRQTRIKEGKKKLVMYSIYAWGVALILTIICAIIDYVPIIQENWKPRMCLTKFWISEHLAMMIYFNVPVGTAIFSNLCFFIATAITIFYHNRHTTQQLRDTESNRFNENKQRFFMYLKLFIVMGISWVMEVLSWINADVNFLPRMFFHFCTTINSLQGLIIFITFVCKKNIMQQLLKRFGGLNCGPFCKISTYNDRLRNVQTLPATSGTMPIQGIGPSNQQIISPSPINSIRSIET